MPSRLTLAISLALTVQIMGAVTMGIWGKGTTGLRPCSDEEAARRRDNWPTFKVGAHPRKEDGGGAKLLNWEKRLERTGPERKGEAGKASEGFV